MRNENSIIRNVGILFEEQTGRGLTHPFFSLILNSFKAEMEEHSYNITFINSRMIQSGISYQECCESLNLDGVCMICADFRAPEVKALAESAIPCITIDHFYKKLPAVLSDNETGIHLLVQHAAAQGHQRIAFVHGQKNSEVTATRVREFFVAMGHYHLPVPEEYVREGVYHDITLTRRIVGELLSLPQRPTCILLPDDTTYLGALEAAQEAGMQIPEDISFAGYDGIPLTQTLSPRLTTIHQNSEEMGRTAAKKLLALIEQPGSVKPMPYFVPLTLIEGETLGACPRETES